MAAFAIPLALTGLSALSGFLSNRKKKQEQESTSTSNINTTDTFDQSNMPMLTPEAMQAYSSLMPHLLNRVNQDPNMSGYAASGLRNIGSAGETARGRITQMLAQKGLGNSPAAAALFARQGDAQSGQEADFRNSIPLLSRQMQGQDLDQLLRAASALPTGMRSTGTSTRTGTNVTNTTGSVTNPGDPWGGLTSGLGQGLASTFGYKWALDQQRNAGIKRPGMGDV
jgi:hypothetical protein